MNLYAIYQGSFSLSKVAHLRRNDSYLIQSRWLTFTGTLAQFAPEYAN